MSKVIERNVAEIIIIGVFLMVFLSSCGSTKEMKKCCKQTVQEVYEYEGLVMDCENCDELD
tara:strand:- start:328 stop:510 length:183 start_codon:yes stop_codon:yes gene_type:complete